MEANNSQQQTAVETKKPANSKAIRLLRSAALGATLLVAGCLNNEASNAEPVSDNKATADKIAKTADLKRQYDDLQARAREMKLDFVPIDAKILIEADIVFLELELTQLESARAANTIQAMMANLETKADSPLTAAHKKVTRAQAAYDEAVKLLQEISDQMDDVLNQIGEIDARIEAGEQNDEMLKEKDALVASYLKLHKDKLDPAATDETDKLSELLAAKGELRKLQEKE